MSITITAVFFALIVLGNSTIPDYIHVCHHDDPDLAGCIKKSVEHLRPRLKSGIPELEIPSIEPFDLDMVSFRTSSEATHLATNLTNIRVYGASNFDILKIVPTLSSKEHKFQFEVVIPELKIEGDYQIDSRVLLLELKGNGPFNANISGFHFECDLKGNKVSKDGVNHVLFENMKCNAVIGKTSIVLKNLFNGNPVLEKATNDVINENSGVLFEEIRPSLLSALAEKFTIIANKITLYFNSEELFP